MRVIRLDVKKFKTLPTPKLPKVSKHKENNEQKTQEMGKKITPETVYTQLCVCVCERFDRKFT